MNDDTMELLDLDDGASLDTLPDAPVFASPRPRRPWLLMGVGIVVILLATYIIVRTISGGSSSSVDIDLDAPAMVVDGDAVMDVNPNAPIMPPMPPAQDGMPPAPAPGMMPPPPAPVVAPKPAPVAPVAEETSGVPVRVIEDRKDVVFAPDKADVATQPVVKPAPKPAAQPVAKPVAKPAPKPAPKKQTVAAQNGSWYVQFGSYSTRAAAESAERSIRNAHQSLFSGRQFVILAAQMPDGTTKYRLRIAFATSADANGFCRNAKSDGLDCYVAK